VESRLAIKALLLLFAASVAAQQPSPNPATTPGNASAPTLVIQGVGKGVVPLDGSWQFHLGDDPHWAEPAYNDANWESIEVNAPWGAQQHPSYTGFA